MKTKLLLTISLTLFSLLANSAIWVANNNPGAATGTNVFTGSTALQDALSNVALADGDIIYVVPSTTSYGIITITKGITIFGIGIRPLKDIANRSLLGLVNINASNVRLSGLILDNDLQLGLTLVSATTLTNITVENCRFPRVEMSSFNGVDVGSVLFRNNVITGTGTIARNFILYTISAFTITNNIIFPASNTGSLRITGANISYNVFIGSGNTNINVDGTLINNLFDHNIFYGMNVDLNSVAGSTGNTWTDNLSFGATNMVFPVGLNGNTGSGNIEDSDPLFTNVPLTQVWNDSYDFTLLGGSPALNVNGQDIGVSGGLTPFDAEGNLLPLIESVTIPAMIPVNTNLDVTIKAKGN